MEEEDQTALPELLAPCQWSRGLQEEQDLGSVQGLGQRAGLGSGLKQRQQVMAWSSETLSPSPPFPVPAEKRPSSLGLQSAKESADWSGQLIDRLTNQWTDRMSQYQVGEDLDWAVCGG